MVLPSAYQDFVSDPGNAGVDSGSAINTLGWTYMVQGQFPEAVALFELNAQSHPEWWRGYSSLGAAYMKVNQNDKAIEVLRKSLELNPNNQVAKGRLKTLGAID